MLVTGVSAMTLNLVTPAVQSEPLKNTSHFADFSAGIPRFNQCVLDAVDAIQASHPDGGGYFIGVHANPAESPVGFQLSLFGHSLIAPPRSSSYCSGSSFTAFIEAENRYYGSNPPVLNWQHYEACRMQETNQARREDDVKLWGYWNADGFGNDFALVQYSKIGERISPNEALPGDFMNISWKSGLGHSTVFLGWCRTSSGTPAVLFWSSQASTNGYSNEVAPLSSIQSLEVVRVTHPERIATFDLNATVNLKVTGDQPPSF